MQDVKRSRFFLFLLRGKLPYCCVANDDLTAEVSVWPCLQLQRCERGGRRVWRGLVVGLGVSNGGEQREAILIISAAAPAFSTYETDRAKHQLMQQHPDGDPAVSHLSSEQWTTGVSRETDGRFTAVLHAFSLFCYPDDSTGDLNSCSKSAG